MTLLQGRTLILGWLSDPNAGYFTSSLVNTWINLAQKQVQGMLLQAGENWYEKPVETITVIGQADYALPNDFIDEHRLEVVLDGTGLNENRRPLNSLTTNEQDLVPITSGQPQAYKIKKDRVTISPTPDAVYTLRLYYSPLVSDLSSDSDVPDVPDQFVELVWLIAAFNGFIQDDRAPQSLLLRKNELELQLKRRAEARTQDKSRYVRQVEDYDNYGVLTF